MSGMFSNLTTDGMEETQDRLGGNKPFDSGIITGTIKAAYAGESAGGAKSVSLIIDVSGREFRTTQWITNKKGENFFLNKEDNSKKVQLPGFVIIDEICLVTTGAPLADQVTEEKTIKLYDFDARAELPKAVQMLTGLLGQEVSLGILHVLENKNEKDGNGEYQPTAETREINDVAKVFHTATKMTVAEARNGQDASFWEKWEERNKGNVVDKRKIKDGEAGKSGRPGGAPPQSGQKTERKSLFGN